MRKKSIIFVADFIFYCHDEAKGRRSYQCPNLANPLAYLGEIGIRILTTKQSQV